MISLAFPALVLCGGNVALSLDDWNPFWPFSGKVSSRLFFALKILEIEKERANKRQLAELKQFKDEKQLEDDEDATVKATLPERGKWCLESHRHH